MNPTANDDLRSARLRLEQNRIHVDGRLDPGGNGLRELRAADLSTIPAHSRVVGHVLRLEGYDVHSLASE
jgi:hypothetical protein